MIKWGITTPSGQVRLDDIPIEVLEGIAKANGGDSWHDLAAAPGANAAAAVALLAHCYTLTGDEPLPSEKVTPRLLLSALEIVPDDLPDTFEGGIPKAEPGDPTTD